MTPSWAIAEEKLNSVVLSPCRHSELDFLMIFLLGSISVSIFNKQGGAHMLDVVVKVISPALADALILSLAFKYSVEK